jgi:hypothetical protein
MMGTEVLFGAFCPSTSFDCSSTPAPSHSRFQEEVSPKIGKD